MVRIFSLERENLLATLHPWHGTLSSSDVCNMKIDLHFESCKSRTWFSARTETCHVYVTGWAAINSHIVIGQDFAEAFAVGFTGGESFSGQIARINGNFALVVATPDSIFLGVDTVRTIPLLYCMAGNTFVVSDSITPLLRGDNRFDENSLVEFYNAGMVTGPYTLYQGIKSLQAGECVRLDRNTGNIEPHRYYRYLSTYLDRESLGELVERLEEVTRAAFSRMIDSLRGRQVVVPLSGGLDSRLVVTMLKRLGYDHVFCFSYGLRDNWESARSKAVAERLGFRWQMVPYHPAMLRQVFRSDSLRQFVLFSGNGVSVPEWNDWPAMEVLKNERLIEPDAVVVNGNSGDFIAGAHLKYLLDPTWNVDPFNLYSAIISKHLTLWHGLSERPSINSIIRMRIDEALAGPPAKTIEDVACLYELWEWQERQAKFPCNQTRVYEFFGHEWRMPLWDLELMRFWQDVPIPYKMDEFLYRRQLSTFDPFGLFQDDVPGEPWTFVTTPPRQNKEEAERWTRKRVKEAILQTPLLGNGLARFFHHRRLHHYYQSHPAGRCRGYGWRRFVLLEHTKRHEISLQMKDYLKALDIEVPALLKP